MLPPPGITVTSAVQGEFSIMTAPSVSPMLSTSAFEPTTVISTIATVAATATAAAVSGQGPHGREDNGECRLLGPFALFVQGGLGAMALLSLVWKRWRERPQRPVKIWAFDASKQVFGSVLVHIANLLMSMLSAGQLTVKATGGALPASLVSDDDKYQPNPCSFYLLNLAIDTTLGIPILILLLRILTFAFSYTSFGKPRESIQSGNYGQPPKAWWWFKQSIIYFMGLMGMKLCVLFIFQILPWISRVGDWALRWTEGDERIQVFFVMLFFPVVMNALQYYIIDSFIKYQAPSEHQPIPNEDEDEGFGDDTLEDDISDHEENERLVRKSRESSIDLDETKDPAKVEVDVGDLSSTVASNSSGGDTERLIDVPKQKRKD